MDTHAGMSTVTLKGQVVIPFWMRRRLGLKKGTRVCWTARESELILRPMTRDYFERMAGSLKSSGRLSKRLLKERSEERARENFK